MLSNFIEFERFMPKDYKTIVEAEQRRLARLNAEMREMVVLK